MARLVSLTIPIPAARAAAQGADRALLVDSHHLVKCALAHAFGDGGIRPWRLAGDDGDAFYVAGWAAPHLTDEEIARRAAGIEAGVHVDEFKPATGDRLILDLHASPQRKRSRREPGTGRRINTAFDAAEGAESVGTAYATWISEKMAEPRSGLKIAGDIRIRSTRAASGAYRNGTKVIQTRIPQVEASIEVVVADGGTFNAFLNRGVGPLAHVGYGSLFPKGISDGA